MQVSGCRCCFLFFFVSVDISNVKFLCWVFGLLASNPFFRPECVNVTTESIHFREEMLSSLVSPEVLFGRVSTWLVGSWQPAVLKTSGSSRQC